MQVRYNLSNTRENNNVHTLNQYEDESTDDDDISQLIRNHTWSNNINGRITWTEPLGDVTRANFLQIAYRANYRFKKITLHRLRRRVRLALSHSFKHKFVKIKLVNNLA